MIICAITIALYPIKRRRVSNDFYYLRSFRRIHVNIESFDESKVIYRKKIGIGRIFSGQTNLTFDFMN